MSNASWIRLDAGARPRGDELPPLRPAWERIAIGPPDRDVLAAVLAEEPEPAPGDGARPAVGPRSGLRRRRVEPAVRAAVWRTPAARASGHDRRHLGRPAGRRARAGAAG